MVEFLSLHGNLDEKLEYIGKHLMLPLDNLSSSDKNIQGVCAVIILVVAVLFTSLMVRSEKWSKKGIYAPEADFAIYV